MIELLVVIAIIGVLAALLFPTFERARKSSHVPKCMNNQRQIVAAILTCAADNQGRLPDVGSEKSGAYSNFYYDKIAEYLNLPPNKYAGKQVMRCPSAKKTEPSTYGINFCSGPYKVFLYESAGDTTLPPTYPGWTGSQRLVNLPSSVLLIADAFDASDTQSGLYYSPLDPNYPLTVDRDGDGVKDSSGNLPAPRKYNNVMPRHGNSNAFVGTAVDGSAKLLTIREWAENPKYWGPTQ